MYIYIIPSICNWPLSNMHVPLDSSCTETFLFAQHSNTSFDVFATLPGVSAFPAVVTFSKL